MNKPPCVRTCPDDCRPGSPQLSTLPPAQLSRTPSTDRPTAGENFLYSVKAWLLHAFTPLRRARSLFKGPAGHVHSVVVSATRSISGMCEDLTVGPPGSVARVTTVSEDGLCTFVELLSGSTATITSSDESPWPIGSVLLIYADDDRVEIAPDDLWPRHSSVGVVKLVTPDATVIDSSGRLELVAQSQVDYIAGNTVEFTKTAGVERVLSRDPITVLDNSTSSAATAERFLRVSNNTSGPTFSDFGGYPEVVRRARELINISLTYRDEMIAIGVKPVKGVLLSGPPGSGKTLLARVVANTAHANFYEISGPEILSKWYGESEQVLRHVFDHAARQPSIVFFDEIDSLAGQRSEDSHEASRRVVTQLLTLMDGFTPQSNVLVVAATNRPGDLDVAFRRPGRFDWEIEFEVPDSDGRRDILKVTSRKMRTSGDLHLDLLADRTEGWSSADLAAIWTEAGILAVVDQRSAILNEDVFGAFERVSASRLSRTMTRRGNNVA